MKKKEKKAQEKVDLGDEIVSRVARISSTFFFGFGYSG